MKRVAAEKQFTRRAARDETILGATRGQTRLLVCVLLLVASLCLANCNLVAGEQQTGNSNDEQLTIESRAKSTNDDLAAAMNYLEKLENLDKYWSEKARPR